MDANQPIDDVQPLSNLVSKLEVERAQLWMLGAFAALAVLQAAIGLYGLLSHLVAQRTRDIGVRMALGASRAQILRGVLAQAFQLVGVGLAAGMVGTLTAEC